MFRRSVVTVVFLSMFLFGIAVVPASAKMPPFEIDVVVENGEVFVSVRVLGIQDSTVPPYGFDPADLDGLLAVYPTSDLDDRGRSTNHDNALPVDLEWSGKTGIYDGRVAFETPGTWAVVPFPTIVEFDPDSAIHEAYPATLYFEAPAEGASVLAVAGAVGALLTVGAFILVRRGRSWAGIETGAQHSMSASPLARPRVEPVRHSAQAASSFSRPRRSLPSALP